jgi:hypothetical protein
LTFVKSYVFVRFPVTIKIFPGNSLYKFKKPIDHWPLISISSFLYIVCSLMTHILICILKRKCKIQVHKHESAV